MLTTLFSRCKLFLQNDWYSIRRKHSFAISIFYPCYKVNSSHNCVCGCFLLTEGSDPYSDSLIDFSIDKAEEIDRSSGYSDSDDDNYNDDDNVVIIVLSYSARPNI